MSASDHTPKEPIPAHTAPGWDVPEEGGTRRSHPARLRLGGSATGWALSDRFDRLLPPHKHYLGLCRRTFLIGAAVVVVVLLALIIGLSVGLTQKKYFCQAMSSLASR
jgi:hypothetical protein